MDMATQVPAPTAEPGAGGPPRGAYAVTATLAALGALLAWPWWLNALLVVPGSVVIVVRNLKASPPRRRASPPHPAYAGNAVIALAVGLSGRLDADLQVLVVVGALVASDVLDRASWSRHTDASLTKLRWLSKDPDDYL